jgi:L-iditol 2-dehydrogenase
VEVLIERELDVHGVNRYCNTFPKAIALLETGQLDVKPLITNHFSFEKVCEAFEFARSNRSSAIKVMVENEGM